MNIHEDAVEAAADEIDDAVGGGTDEGWADRTARAALEAAWAVMLPEITDDEIARDLDSRIPNGSPLWLERQVADRRAIADTVRHFARGGHSSTE